CKQSYNLFTF
nr:immunoglobulin light chain junction region [Mus musculus]